MQASTSSRCWTGHRQRPSQVVSGKGKGQFCSWETTGSSIFALARQAAVAACFPSGCTNDVSSQPGHVCIRNQYTASQCCGSCLCIRVRLCLSPALVSLLSLSFHLADGLICFVVFGLFCFVVCFALVGLPWSVTGSCPSVAIVFESIAPLTFSIVGHHSLPCLCAS